MERLKQLPHIYLTLKCNGGCPYCSNICPGYKGAHEYDELPWETWAKLLRCLDFPSFIFTGGEPFLYYGTGELLVALNRPAQVYTNLSLPLTPTLDNVDPKLVSIRASYHPHVGSWSQFTDNMKYLEERKIKTTIHAVLTLPPLHKVQSATLPDMRSNLFRKHGLELKLEYDQRLHTHKTGKVACSPHSIIIAPDGSLFHCVSRMVRNVQPGTLALLDMGRPATVCTEPEACCPCDLASAYQEEMKEGDGAKPGSDHNDARSDEGVS